MVVFCGRSSYDYKIEKLRTKNDNEDIRALNGVGDVHRNILNFINPTYEIYPLPPRKGNSKNIKN